MDMPDVINMVASLLGHMPVPSRSIQKNVADGVMIKLLEMMSSGKYSEGELKRLINNLTVDKVHEPNRRRLRIRYEEGK